MRVIGNTSATSQKPLPVPVSSTMFPTLIPCSIVLIYQVRLRLCTQADFFSKKAMGRTAS